MGCQLGWRRPTRPVRRSEALQVLPRISAVMAEMVRDRTDDDVFGSFRSHSPASRRTSRSVIRTLRRLTSNCARRRPISSLQRIPESTKRVPMPGPVAAASLLDEPHLDPPLGAPWERVGTRTGGSGGHRRSLVVPSAHFETALTWVDTRPGPWRRRPESNRCTGLFRPLSCSFSLGSQKANPHVRGGFLLTASDRDWPPEAVFSCLARVSCVFRVS